MGRIDAGLLASFSERKGIDSEVVFLSNLSVTDPLQASILSLLHATYPFQVRGTNPLALADMVLDSVRAVRGFVYNGCCKSTMIKIVKGSHLCAFQYKKKERD